MATYNRLYGKFTTRDLIRHLQKAMEQNPEIADKPIEFYNIAGKTFYSDSIGYGKESESFKIRIRKNS